MYRSMDDSGGQTEKGVEGLERKGQYDVAARDWQHEDILNRGTDEEMTAIGYIRCMWRTVLTWIFIILTVGILRLIFYWKPYWFLRCTHRIISLREATHLHLQDQYQQDFVVKVKRVYQWESSDKKGVTNEAFSEEKSTASMSSINVLYISHESQQTGYRYFNCKKVKYIFSEEKNRFERLCGIEDGKRLTYFHDSPPLTTSEAAIRAALYGYNKLEVHLTRIYVIIAREIISPFYIFQLFSVCLWYASEYEYYASVILFLSIVSIIITTVTTRQMERALKSTVHQFASATVRRNGEVKTVLPTELVPGDIIEIPRSGLIMDCDAVLLTGNCIVNESMLTGESIPVTKTPLPNPHGSNEMYDPKNHQKHTLYCGTKVIQCRYYGEHAVTAMVVRTGFMTAKGGLIRSIMFPKPVDFKFYRETYYFVGALAFLALAGLIYLAVIWSDRDRDQEYIALKVLDLITIAVPPLLPAALAVGIIVGQTRLKTRHMIYCIQPSYINIAGSINVVCFDKTGTLTEDGLDMHSVIPIVDKRLTDIHVKDVSTLPSDSLVKIAMATCHSLTYIDGQLSGDPLDLKMFESTGWSYRETGEEQNRFDMIMPAIVKQLDMANSPEIGIIRQFTFSSSLQRMSVITKNLASPTFDLFAKGSPEMISSLCKPETLPTNFSDILAENTQQGFRVIGLAYRTLDLTYAKLHRVERSDVEADMTFLGLVIMENRLKPETIPVIAELHEANIRTIMVTGDNLLTAVSVAQVCKLIPEGRQVILVSASEQNGQQCINFYSENYQHSNNNTNGKESGSKLSFTEKSALDIEKYRSTDYCFAMTGKTWERIRSNHSDIIAKIVAQGCVYARMSPDQKAQLIEELQSIGYYVAMCGDGANDCGALKVAHSGISLSEAEASVASPFTSKKANISCVPHLIKEGRCALVTSFGIFKFICGYSLCQYISAIILRTLNNDLSDFEFLVIDLFFTTSLSITFPLTNPADRLHKLSPPVHLLDFLPIMSILLTAAVFGGTQVGSMYIAQTNWTETYADVNMSWYYNCSNLDETDTHVCPDNVFVILLSFYQYITLAVMFAKGSPYRKHMFTNYFFLNNVAALFIVTTWVTMHPTTHIAEWLELEENIPYEFKAGIVGLGVLTMFFCILYEELITGNTRVHAALERLKTRLTGNEMKYNVIKRELASSSSWPPVQKLENGFAEVLSKELNLSATSQ